MTKSTPQKQCPIVGIGASAGGLEAVNEMLGAIGEGSELAFVIVQHLDPTHESMMAELMDRRTGLTVRQIEGGEKVTTGNAYVIPPGSALTINNGILALKKFSEPRGMRRPIDDFFQSLADDQGGNAACVILSGTGADGSAGLRGIKEKGGVCLAQQPDTARYDGMPMSAVGTGLVDFILPPEDIYERLESFFTNKANGGTSGKTSVNVADHLNDICYALRASVGHDFSGYKHSTLIRRIERRMHVLEIFDAGDYLRRIQSDDRECEALLRDLLINVTSFFRDKKMFRSLREKAVEKIVASADKSDTIRVWIAGCSSGEEAYTIAILFAEAMKDLELSPSIQIFATDIDTQMLSQAREGRYSLSGLKDIPERLRETYTFGRDGHFEITPHVRDMIHFSNHSLIKDPPFSKLDMIACRNLLIYLGDKIQTSIIPLFHYALKPGGTLFLGSSESIGRREDLFNVVDQKSRIFERLEGSVPYPIDLPISRDTRPIRRKSRPYTRLEASPEAIEQTASVQRLIERYTPANIVVDEEGEILSSNGKLSKFLEFPTGAPTTHVLTLARKGLREALSPLLRDAVEHRKRQARQNIEVSSEFGTQMVDIVVDPLTDGTLLIVLPETEGFRQEFKDDVVDPAQPQDRVHDLEEELRLTRFRLRSTVEELETANEELKSSNEEMMSMNEELQSANEELSTVNEEIKNKADQLSTMNDDMRHFLESTELALIVLDEDFKIRTFTDPIIDVYPLKDADKGRLLNEVVGYIDDTSIIEDSKRVANGDEVPTRLVSRKDGTKKFTLRIRPFRTHHGRIEGVTITFTDVSELREMETELRLQTDRLRIAMTAAGVGVWDFETESGVSNIDAKVRELFQMPQQGELLLADALSLMHPEDRKQVNTSLDEAIANHTDWRQAFRVPLDDGTVRWLQGAGRIEKTESGPQRMFGVNFDITAEKEANEAQTMLIGEMNHRVKNLFAIISAIVSLAGREAETVADLVSKVRENIAALGRAHDVSRGEGDLTHVALSNLLRSIFLPYSQTNTIKYGGTEIEVPTDFVTPIGLIFHEWATNSMKYGALSTDKGQIDLKWSLQELDKEESELIITWNESKGPKVIAPEDSSGFGTKLVGHSASQLGGKVETDWDTDGVSHRLFVTLGK